MSSAVVSKRLINSEEYHKMGETGLLHPDENVELINGEIYNMAPIGSKHFAVVNKLTALFVPAFIHQFIISVQNPIRIDHWNEPEPDVVILKYKKDEYISAIPGPTDVVTVIEVSDTSHDFDKNVKLPIYASSGIPVYWIVDLNNNIIEEYTNPRENQYMTRNTYILGDKITLENISFEVSKILISVS